MERFCIVYMTHMLMIADITLDHECKLQTIVKLFVISSRMIFAIALCLFKVEFDSRSGKFWGINFV